MNWKDKMRAFQLGVSQRVWRQLILVFLRRDYSNINLHPRAAIHSFAPDMSLEYMLMLDMKIYDGFFTGTYKASQSFSKQKKNYSYSA